MASTRIQQAQLVLSVAFQQQIMGSLLALCSFIVTQEAAGVANHANRLVYANAILVNPLAQATFIAPGLMSQAAILADAGNTVAGASGTVVPDADCDAAVLVVFNFYANQWVAQLNSGSPLHIGG